MVARSASESLALLFAADLSADVSIVLSVGLSSAIASVGTASAAMIANARIFMTGPFCESCPSDCNRGTSIEVKQFPGARTVQFLSGLPWGARKRTVIRRGAIFG